MRLFLAIELPPEARSALAGLAESLRKPISAADQIQWVAPDLFHITLKFLGACEPERVAELVRALREPLSGWNPFSLTLTHAGCFPPRGMPSVLWFGSRDAASPCSRLAQAIDAACAGLGFAREKRPFHAHVTFGRVKSLRDGHLWRGRLDALKCPPIGPIRVDHVSLMQSLLSPRGPRYTTLAIVPLMPPPDR
jgi:2'-5' RNA ligase